jgi:hypothetical protein
MAPPEEGSATGNDNARASDFKKILKTPHHWVPVAFIVERISNRRVIEFPVMSRGFCGKTDEHRWSRNLRTAA